MKTAADPRHQIRREAVRELFAEGFTKQAIKSDLVRQILSKRAEIDQTIKGSAPEWPIEKINRVDLAILRLAIHELYEGITPPKVVIDEAVEIAKEFGSENSASFVNGVLGTIYSQGERI